MSTIGENLPEPSDDTLPCVDASVPSKPELPNSSPITDCLGEDDVQAFAQGAVSPEQHIAVEAHLDTCAICLMLVSLVAREFGGPAFESAHPVWPTTFARGSVLAERFDIVRFVARGGMGEVYEAFDRNLRERVALKTLLCTVPDTAPAVRQLCEEVRLSRRVAHRNVCRIHELHVNRDPRGERPPVYFLAMQFVEGETLKERLRTGAIPFDDVCVIARQLLAGLGAAHASDVLHLDFKSQNVMLRKTSTSLEPIIMDFGLSRAFDTEARMRTSERHVAGSAGYMSPEQIECKPACEASDLYAFGAVLFEMLTGRMAYDGESAASVMMKQLASRAPAPSSVSPGLPPVLDAFVLRCLSRHPSARYADAESARLAFEQCLRDGPRSIGRYRGRLLAVGSAGLVACGASTYYFAGDLTEARREHEHRLTEPVEQVRSAVEGGTEGEPTTSASPHEAVSNGQIAVRTSPTATPNPPDSPLPIAQAAAFAEGSTGTARSRVKRGAVTEPGSAPAEAQPRQEPLGGATLSTIAAEERVTTNPIAANSDTERKPMPPEGPAGVPAESAKNSSAPHPLIPPPPQVEAKPSVEPKPRRPPATALPAWVKRLPGSLL